MKVLLLGAASMLALQVLLILGAYELRLTPEVVNCDKGRQTVDVRVTKSWRSYVSPPIVKRKIGHCRVWYQTSGGVVGVGGSELLQALGRCGKLTAVEAALESSLSVEEAERILSELAAKGHLQVIVEHGRLYYAFWERD